jgi:hypothetical protein
MNRLKFFRLVDEAGRVSLTNIFVICSIVAHLVSPSLVSVACLLIAFAAYETKRFFINTASDLATLENRLAHVMSELEETKAKVGQLHMKAAISPGWKAR